MATQIMGQAAWDNQAGYIRLVWDDVTLDITGIVFANGSTRPRRVQVWDFQRNRYAVDEVLAPGTPETTIPAPAQLRFVQDTDGSLSIDPRWSLRTGWA